MFKKDLVAKVAKNTGIAKKEVSSVVDAVFNEIADELAQGGKVQINKFGTFESVLRSAKTCYNFKTGGTNNVPAHRAVRFRQSEVLKDYIAEV